MATRAACGLFVRAMPRASAVAAARCSGTSIVSTKFAPGTTGASVSSTLVTRPIASTSTCCRPEAPRSSASKLASTPARPITSSRAYPSATRDSVNVGGIGPTYPITCPSKMLSGYARTGVKRTTTPGRLVCCSSRMSAWSRVSGDFTRTGVNGSARPGSTACRTADGAIPMIAPRRTKTASCAARSRGRSVTRTLAVKLDTLRARTCPPRS